MRVALLAAALAVTACSTASHPPHTCECRCQCPEPVCPFGELKGWDGEPGDFTLTPLQEDAP